VWGFEVLPIEFRRHFKGYLELGAGAGGGCDLFGKASPAIVTKII